MDDNKFKEYQDWAEAMLIKAFSFASERRLPLVTDAELMAVGLSLEVIKLKELVESQGKLIAEMDRKVNPARYWVGGPR